MATAARQGPVKIGSRRELFVDSLMVGSLHGGAARKLHAPTPQQTVLVLDKEWERGGYITVFKDGDLYRMYYQGVCAKNCDDPGLPVYGSDDTAICYAESSDGIHWHKPEIGKYSFGGSKKNNIIYAGKGSHGFSPFIDTRPDCPPSERYKAFGRSRFREDVATEGSHLWRMLFLLTSPDGLNWTVKDGPKRHGSVMDRNDGHFDSQNVAFWDAVQQRYRLYFRWRRALEGRDDLVGRDDGEDGRSRQAEIRDTGTAVSDDLLHWGEGKLLDYPGSPLEEMYTNQVLPYYRAPHIYLGFPTRYVEDRGPLTDWHRQMMEVRPGRYFQSYTDGLLMSSRDGEHFERWGEAFLRPGMPEDEAWGYGECYQCWGMLETPAEESEGINELSFFVTSGRRHGDHDSKDLSKRKTRRYTLRLDGFVSVNAPLAGGELLTPALIFEGNQLLLNMSTSAAGGIKVEVQDDSCRPVSGFSLADSVELFGNSLERVVTWKGGSDVSSLAGKPVRLRFVMTDADLYSFQFTAVP